MISNHSRNEANLQGESRKEKFDQCFGELFPSLLKYIE